MIGLDGQAWLCYVLFFSTNILIRIPTRFDKGKFESYQVEEIGFLDWSNLMNCCFFEG